MFIVVVKGIQFVALKAEQKPIVGKPILLISTNKVSVLKERKLYVNS